MTAETKAIELINKFAKGEPYLSYAGACNCAVISVDEILDMLGDVGVYGFADPKVSEYWEDVKNIILELK